MSQTKKSIAKRCRFVLFPMGLMLICLILCTIICISGYGKTMNFYTVHYRSTADFTKAVNEFESKVKDYADYSQDSKFSEVQEAYEKSRSAFSDVLSKKTDISHKINNIVNDISDKNRLLDDYMTELKDGDNNDAVIKEMLDVFTSIDNLNTDLIDAQTDYGEAVYSTKRTGIIVCEVLALVSFIGLISVSAYFIYFVNKRIAQPISDITGWAHLFDDGYSEMTELDYDIDDEIGQISKSFNIVRQELIEANKLKSQYNLATRKLKDEEEHKKKVVQQLYVEKREKETISTEAKQDGLTGLYNRRTFDNIVDDFITRKPGGAEGTLFLIDMDNFKSVNDSLGHLAGDEALKTLAGAMRIIYPGAYLGRYGGDEFIAFKVGVKSDDEAKELADDLCRKMHRDLEYEGRVTGLSVSIGVADTVGLNDYSELYMRADKALYYAKEHGRNQYAFFSQT